MTFYFKLNIGKQNEKLSYTGQTTFVAELSVYKFKNYLETRVSTPSDKDDPR